MLDNPKGGIGYAAEFQSSALPYVTSAIAPAAGSPDYYKFPKVTRFITVNNLSTGSSTLSFGFTWNGVVSTSHKYILLAGQAITLELRIKDMWLQGESGTPPYSLCAGLTNITRDVMPLLTGTLHSGDPGWDGIG